MEHASPGNSRFRGLRYVQGVNVPMHIRARLGGADLHRHIRFRGLSCGRAMLAPTQEYAHARSGA